MAESELFFPKTLCLYLTKTRFDQEEGKENRPSKSGIEPRTCILEQTPCQMDWHVGKVFGKVKRWGYIKRESSGLK